MAKLLPVPYLPTLEQLDEIFAKAPKLPDQLLPWPITASSLRGRQDPKKGVPLDDARFWFGPDHLVERYAEIKTSGSNNFFQRRMAAREWLAGFEADQHQLQSLREKLELVLLNRLLSDELVATGYGSHDPLDAKPTRLTADRWRILDPNFGKCEAAGAGIIVSGIRVFDPALFGARNIEKEIGAFSQSRLLSWYQSWIEQNTTQGTIPSRDEDWTMARKMCGNSVPRDAVRELRRTHAPQQWKKQGRPRTDRA